MGPLYNTFLTYLVGVIPEPGFRTHVQLVCELGKSGRNFTTSQLPEFLGGDLSLKLYHHLNPETGYINCLID